MAPTATATETATVTYLGRPELLHLDEKTGAPIEDDIYSGYDPATRELIHLAVDVPTEVSAAKAEQLAADFPGVFEINGDVAGEREPTPDGQKSRQEIIDGSTRAELNAAAHDAGVENPEELPNKGAVADAIIAKVDERDAAGE